MQEAKASTSALLHSAVFELLFGMQALCMEAEAGADAARAHSGAACSCAPPATALLQRHRVGGVPFVYYLPDYLSAAEDYSLASTIRASKQRWTQARRSYADALHLDGAAEYVARGLTPAHTRRCPAGACKASAGRCTRRAAF